MQLTVELEVGANPEVAICFDAEGLAFLIKRLEALLVRVDHDHLMTPSWAGNELTEDAKGGERYQLIHSLRLVRLPD